MMSRKTSVLVLALCTAALALTQGHVEAQTVPFKIVGGGVGPDGLPLPGEPARSHWSVGEATGLGEYSGEGFVQTDSATPQSNGWITGEFGSAGPYMFTDKDGDVLACYYGRTDFGASTPGTFTLIPLPALGQGVYMAYFIAEFVPYDPECTGKFAGVTGGWTMYAVSGPFVLGSDEPLEYVWSGEGTLTFAHRK
jgi:hypothetical protein